MLDRSGAGTVGDAYRRLDPFGRVPELVALRRESLRASPAQRPADAGGLSRASAFRGGSQAFPDYRTSSTVMRRVSMSTCSGTDSPPIRRRASRTP